MKKTFPYTFKKLSLFLLFLAPSLFSLAQVSPTLLKKVEQKQMNQWVDSTYRSMTLDQKVGQVFMMMLPGGNTSANRNRIATLVEDQHIGGIFFTRSTIQNYASLVNYAQSLATVPLLVGIDGEWGLGMRINDTTPWPKNMMLGAISNDSLIYKYGKEVARQCRVMGIHVNFSPSIDVNTNPNNPVIGYRSYGEDPERVAQLGILFSKGLEDGGVLSVAKHFPGHGDTATDSHHTLPVINHNIDRLFNVELVPFIRYINEGLSGMMVGHLDIPALDNTGQPSSLSRPIVTDLLKNELGFTGITFTDGMEMRGVSSEKNHALRALLAGNDVVLSPIYPVQEIKSVKEALKNKEISEAELEAKVKKILAYKYALGIRNKQSVKVDTKDIEHKLNTSYADWLNRKLNEGSITLLKDDNDLIPLQNLDKRKIASIAIGSTSKSKFQDMLSNYADVDIYQVKNMQELETLKPKLAKYNTVLISIHSHKLNGTDTLNSLLKDKESVLISFIYPYHLIKYKNQLNLAKAVIIGYEDTELANDFTAQAIFGGRSLTGRLPISLGDNFPIGTGIIKKKTRLAYGSPEEVGIIDSVFTSNINNIIEEGIREKAYPGAQLLIAKDGIIIANNSYGTFAYDNRKVTNDDIYDLASVTKAAATLPAIMKLHSNKQIQLSDLLKNYIPQLAGSNKEDLTIKDALLHETGIVSYIPYYNEAIDKTSYEGKLFSYTADANFPLVVDNKTYAKKFSYKKDIISKDAKDGSVPLANDLYISEAFQDSILAKTIDSKLRKTSNYNYSCLNFMLLKEAIENITKENLNDYLQKNFYKKLGANTTMYRPLNKFSKDRIVPTEKDEFLRNQVVQGYVHDEAAAFMGGISGNAGLFSNANDLAKLFQMWLNGGTYGDEQYLDLKTVMLFTKGKSARSRRGYGFDKPEPALNRSSPTSPSTPLSTYGHTGFTGTCFWIDPDNNVIYILLTNRVYPKRYPNKLNELSIRSRVQEEIYKAINESKKH